MFEIRFLTTLWAIHLTYDFFASAVINRSIFERRKNGLSYCSNREVMEPVNRAKENPGQLAGEAERGLFYIDNSVRVLLSRKYDPL